MQLIAPDGAILDVENVRISRTEQGRVSISLVVADTVYQLSRNVGNLQTPGEFALNTKDIPAAEHYIAQLHIASNTGRTLKCEEHEYPIYVLHAQYIGKVVPKKAEPAKAVTPVQQPEKKVAKNYYFPIAEVRNYNDAFFFTIKGVDYMVRTHRDSDEEDYGFHTTHTLVKIVPKDETKD